MRFLKWGQNEHDVQLDFFEALVTLLVGRNQPNKEIAALLHVSEVSVAKVLRHLMLGLRLRNRGELAQWAMQHPEAFMGAQVDPHIEPLKIADMQLLRLISQPDAEIGRRLHLPAAIVALRIKFLLELLHLRGRDELRTWSKENPTAIQLGWSHTDLHPVDCTCGRPYCHLSSLLSSLLEAAAVVPIAHAIPVPLARVVRSADLNFVGHSLLESVLTSPGADIPSARGIRWGAVNAVTYDLCRNDNTRNARSPLPKKR